VGVKDGSSELLTAFKANEASRSKGLEMDANIDSKDHKGKLDKVCTYIGTSKGVTRDRLSTSHKVIFVDNLPSSIDKNKFVELFQKFGVILDVKLLKHKTGAETGYGFVEFEEEGDGKKAIRELNWKWIESRNIRVSRAKPPTNKVSGTNLYVENIPFEWTDEMVFDHFSNICDITQARVLVNQKNGDSRGVGFVHCSCTEEANKAMMQINSEDSGKNGLKLRAQFAKIPRAERKLQRWREGEGESEQKGTSTNQNNQDVDVSEKVVQPESGSKKEDNNSLLALSGIQKPFGGKVYKEVPVADVPNHRDEKRKQKVRKQDKRQHQKKLQALKRQQLQAVDDYDWHLNNYPIQPELNRPHSPCRNCRKTFRPSWKPKMFNQDQKRANTNPHLLPQSRVPIIKPHYRFTITSD